MSNGNGTTCKEQCIQSKCIIQEKPINNNGDKKEDCSETYKKLCSCLQQCLMEKCKEAKKKQQNNNDC